MRASMKSLIPVLATALVLSACGSDSSANHRTAAAPSRPTGAVRVSSNSDALVKTAVNSKLGAMVLVDALGEQTYKGMPPYTFAQDKATGEANGQGLKDGGVWNAVTANASPAGTPAGRIAPARPASAAGGGYAY